MVIGLSTAGQLEVHSSLHVFAMVTLDPFAFAKRREGEQILKGGRSLHMNMDVSCILEGSALGRKGLMHVLHLNMDVSCILEGSTLGRKGLMYVLHMNTFVDSL